MIEIANNYIDSFINFEKIPKYSYSSSFRLDRMYAFLKSLGNPHSYLKTIHIAGSKGKGSTCAIIAQILKSAGYKAGLYTSPHLLDVRERIKVLGAGGGFITKDEFEGIIEKIKPVAERFRDHKKFGKLSFFEALTAMAFLYFQEKKVDIAVLETGLGGRLDATNVTNPLVCGITNISLEHTDKLGGTLREIAQEKAGIIKEQRMVVSAYQEKAVIDVIRDTCREKKSKLYEVGKDISFSMVDSNIKRQIFDLRGPGYEYRGLELCLIGSHQVENAALAIGIIKSKIEVNEDAVREGLKNVSWPGRLQIIQRGPYIVLDGAQNVASIKAVLSSIKCLFKYKSLILVFGILKDKDIEGVSRELYKETSCIILTKACSSRSVETGALSRFFPEKDVSLTDNVRDALNIAKGKADKDDLILVTGSLYVVGEALRWVQ